MNVKRQKIGMDLLCFSSGLLAALAFSVDWLFFLCFFALVPLLNVILHSPPERTLRAVWIYCIGYYPFSLYWLYTLLPSLPMGKAAAIAVMTLGILLLSALECAFLLLAFLPFSSLCKRGGTLWKAALFSILYMLGEWLQGAVTTLAFPWVRLCIPVTHFPAWIQSASLFGGLFISFLVVLTNSLLAYAWVTRLHAKRQWGAFAALCGLVLANVAYGAVRLSLHPGDADTGTLMVQGNYAGQHKWTASVEEMLDNYLTLSYEGVTEETRLVLWPESALPVNLREEDEILEKLQAFCQNTDTGLLVGAYDAVQTEKGPRRYNAMFYIDASGVADEAYYKQILVPFGEYMPLEELVWRVFPQLMEPLQYQLNKTPGTESIPLVTPYGKIGGLICYESVFPQVARSSIRNGAQLLMVPSNDSWFGNTSALRQHHAQAILRAVENHRYLIRASSTGVTSAISPYGEVIVSAEPFQACSVGAQVSFLEDRTLYSYIGDAIVLPAICLWIWGLYLRLKQRYLQRKRT